MTQSDDAPQPPSAIYVWLVPSEQMLEQPGSWRIRKWDTEPFPEANFTLRSETATPQGMAHDMAAILQTACDADEGDPRELLRQIASIASKYPWPAPACASPNRNVAKRLRQAFADGDWGAVEDIADLLDERLDTDKEAG